MPKIVAYPLSITLAALNLCSDSLMFVPVTEAEDIVTNKETLGDKLETLVRTGAVTKETAIWINRFSFLYRDVLPNLFAWLVGASADAIAIVELKKEIYLDLIGGLLCTALGVYYYNIAFRKKIDNHVLALITDFATGYEAIRRDPVKGMEFLSLVIVNALTRGIAFAYIFFDLATQYGLSQESPVLAACVVFLLIFNFVVTLFTRTLPVYQQFFGDVMNIKRDKIKTKCAEIDFFKENNNFDKARLCSSIALMSLTRAAPIFYFLSKNLEKSLGRWNLVPSVVIAFFFFFLPNGSARYECLAEKYAASLLSQEKKGDCAALREPLDASQDQQEIETIATQPPLSKKIEEKEDVSVIQTVSFIISMGGRVARWFAFINFMQGLAELFADNHWLPQLTTIDIVMINILFSTIVAEADAPTFNKCNKATLAQHVVRAECAAAVGGRCKAIGSFLWSSNAVLDQAAAKSHNNNNYAMLSLEDEASHRDDEDSPSSYITL